MKINKGKTFLAFTLILMIYAVCLQPVFAETQEDEWIRAIREQIEKMQQEKERTLRSEPRLNRITKNLLELEDTYKQHGKESAKEHARNRRLILTDDQKVMVIIFLEANASAETFDEQRFASLGGQIVEKHKGTIVALIAIDQIRNIFDKMKGIDYVTVPNKPVPLHQNREAKTAAADASQPVESTGQGGKIAVINAGFGGLSNAMQAGKLPATVKFVNCVNSKCLPADFSGENALIESDVQGIALAEILYEKNPDAQLFLIKYDSDDSLIAAVDYCRANGINLIKIFQ